MARGATKRGGGGGRASLAETVGVAAGAAKDAALAAAVASKASSAGPQPGQLVKGYWLLRVPLAPGLPVSRGLLVKRHEARDPEERETARRTLFVTHLDNFTTETQLSRCFASVFGPVERVEIKSVDKKAPRAEQRADGVTLHVNFARVIFKEGSSVDKAIEAATGRVATSVLPLPVSELKEQLRAGREAYRDPAELRGEVDAWMANFDASEFEKRRLARATAVDDDGFTKVVSGITRLDDGTTIRAAKRPSLKTGAFAEPIAGVQASSPILDMDDGEGPKKKKKIREMPDFYRFQQREGKRQEIMDYRKRKVEDEEKVEYMLKKKKFKVKTDGFVV